LSTIFTDERNIFYLIDGSGEKCSDAAEAIFETE